MGFSDAGTPRLSASSPERGSLVTDPTGNGAPSLEDAERERLLAFGSWWSRMWDGGALGKTGIVLVMTAVSLPFIVDLGTVLIAWFYVWPQATEVMEKVAVLSFVFVVLTAIGLQVRGVAYQLLYGLFITRPRRSKRKT